MTSTLPRLTLPVVVTEELRKWIAIGVMSVCAARSIAAYLYLEIVRLRPDWQSDADDKGKVKGKVVYTADPGDEEHVTRQLRRPSAIAAVKQRVKDPGDELELIIVKDTMLTGFNAPALHTSTARSRGPCSCRPSPA